jgi:uncharacterized repeat protein (TIGR03803 family)
VTQDAEGNFYGTTDAGGTSNVGTVFKLSKAGKETVLHSFKGGADDGAVPLAGVMLDAKGNLFGTTAAGGDLSCPVQEDKGCGVVFQLSPTGKFTVLYRFTGGADGAIPHSGVIQDTDGNLYGTTEAGGENCDDLTQGCGVVFKLSKTRKLSVLHTFTGSFTGNDGAIPIAGVIRDAQGNLYGTTSSGGANVAGTVFKLSTTRKETLLYSFCSIQNCPDGASPDGGLVQDAQGNLYGTTYEGGEKDCGVLLQGCGVVFKLNKTGHEIVLHTFTAGTDGAMPFAGVILDTKGNLYGTTVFGGASGAGTVFKLSKTGKETVLLSFTGGADGSLPLAGMILAKGNLYGTTYEGGDLFCSDHEGCGVVFTLRP